MRLDCAALGAQAFVKRGHHFQGAEVLEIEQSTAAHTKDMLPATEPCLIWLESGEQQIIEKRALKPLSFSALMNPVAAKSLPTWEPPTPQAQASQLKNKARAAQPTYQALSLKGLGPKQASKDFLDAIAQGKSMPKRRSKHHSSRSKGNLGSRLLRMLTTAQLKKRISSKNNAHTPSSNTSRLVQPRRGFSLFDKGLSATAHATNQLWTSFRDFWQRQIMRSQLGALIGKRQAEYFNRMIREFQRGNLSEALKMAVPLSDYRSALDNSPAALFGLPRKRQTLKITQRRASVGRSFSFAEDAYAQMRTLYERAYEQLIKDEQHKEAAFVLVELLGRVSEGVDYLEKHGFVKEAAEVAEGHLQERPEKAVQLWIKAGDLNRAVALAIRSNRFQASLMLLKGTQHYAQLENIWIARLLKNGDFETLFYHYIQNRHHKNGAEAAKKREIFFHALLPQHYRAEPLWLARYCAFMPWSEIEAVLKCLFEKPWEPEFAEFLAAFDAIATPQKSNWRTALKQRVSQPLAKECYRQIMMYQGSAFNLKNRQINLIGSLITDRLFMQCRPQTFSNTFVPAPPRQARTDHTQTFQFRSSEALISDIGLTTDGRCCVAMGDLGVQIYSRRGRLLRHLPIPADGLVSPLFGDVFLAVEHREKVQRMHHIQLHRLKERFFAQSPLAAYGRHHNGMTWPVAIENRLALIDVDATEWSKVWSTSRLEGSIHSIKYNQNHLTFFVYSQMEDRSQIDLWQYRLPQLRLNNRSGIEKIQMKYALSEVAIGQDGQLHGLHTVRGADKSINKSIIRTEFYRSTNLRSYHKIGHLEADSLLLKETAPAILYRDDTLLVLSIPDDLQQHIKVYGVTHNGLRAMFEINSSLGSVAIQVVKNWIAIAAGTQALLYNRTAQKGTLINVS